MRERTTFYYGWYVTASAFLITFIGFGSAYTFSAFIVPIQTEFGATRAEISLVFAIAGFLYFSLGIISGPLADRFGARVLCMCGVICIVVGLAGAALARSLPQLLGSYSLGVGLGVGLSYVPTLGLVQHWFVQRRALATGIAVSGIGFGTLIMPPIANSLIEHVGWRTAYVVIAGSMSALGILALTLIRNDPKDLSLQPEGAQTPLAQGEEVHGVPLRSAIQTKAFRLIYAGTFATAFGAFIPFVQLMPYATNIGLSLQVAGYMVPAIGLGSTLARFTIGGLADRIGRVKVLGIMMAGISFTLGAWPFCTTFHWLVVFALSFGLFYGGWVAVLPAVMADMFGKRDISGIIGALYTSVAFGTASGPFISGVLFDWTGSYSITLVATGAASVIGPLALVVAVPLVPSRQCRH